MSEIPIQIERKMNSEYLERLREASNAIHRLFIYHGDVGLKDLQSIFPLKNDTFDRTEMDTFIVPILIYLDQKTKKAQYDESLDLDPLDY